MSAGSGSGEFCPRCGDAIERPPEVDLPAGREGRDGGPTDPDAVLCDGCYFESFDLVDAPERVEVQVCSQCGAVHRGNRWVDVGARDYTDIAVEETADRLAVHL
ncbi:hypothetical protein BRC84_01955, partial [Halobacteriales archaeon QS_1_68_44]